MYIFSESQLIAESICIYLNTIDNVVVSGISTEPRNFDKLIQLMRIDILIVIGYQKTFVRHILHKTKTINHTKTLLILPEQLKSQIQLKPLKNNELISFSEKLDRIKEKLLYIVQEYSETKPVDNKHILHVITRREKEVLRLIKNGKTTEEIAIELFVSVKTVENHRNNILRKTNSKSMISLMADMYKLGVFEF